MSRRRQGKRDKERKVLAFMIREYCRRSHGPSPLCEACSGLFEYAQGRLDKCPFGDAKKSCGACRIHCYSGEYRQEIKAVMRQIGPRMLYLMPMEFLRHLRKG